MTAFNYETQFLQFIHKIMAKGTWVENKRTGERCLTIIDHEFVIRPDDVPLLYTKQSFPVSAVAEMLGYLRGYDNAAQFDAIGSKTWYDNANKTQAWLDNPHRKGEGDIGKAYGVVARNFGGIDLVRETFDKIAKREDDRGLTITFWKPDDFDKACLRPCMHTHTFSILGDTIHLTSYQRSCDVMLGCNFNSIQCYFLLMLAARISGLKQGNVYHKIVNAHIYESHLGGVETQLERAKHINTIARKNPVKMELNDSIQTIDDVISVHTHARDVISVSGYEHLGRIDFDMVV